MKRYIAWIVGETAEFTGKELDAFKFKNTAWMPRIYCVDTEITNINYRYGALTSNGGWKVRSLGLFPKQFRMHLLLMGVG